MRSRPHNPLRGDTPQADKQPISGPLAKAKATYKTPVGTGFCYSWWVISQVNLYHQQPPRKCLRGLAQLVGNIRNKFGSTNTLPTAFPDYLQTLPDAQIPCGPGSCPGVLPSWRVIPINGYRPEFPCRESVPHAGSYMVPAGAIMIPGDSLRSFPLLASEE